MQALRPILDSSNFSIDHQWFRSDLKNKLHFLKSETADRTIQHIITLAPKVYSIRLFENDDDVITCKGIKRTNLGTHLTYDDFQRTLKHGTINVQSFQTFISNHHTMQTKLVQRVGLTLKDVKR